MFKQKSDTVSASAAPADPVQQARTRARQRLIGAIVLLGIGIIGFPLVFETQPRPIPVDIPIDIPRKDALPPLAAPPATLATGASGGAAAARSRAAAPVEPRPIDEVVTEPGSEGGSDVAARAASQSTPGPEAESARRPAPAAAVARASAPAVAPAPKPAASATPAKPGASAAAVAKATAGTGRSGTDGDRAKALLEGRAAPAATPPSTADSSAQRFVVQVGAFADADAARETRVKVEKLGMKTYTQVAQTAGGSRIRVRVGPFASRGDAEAALAKAKAAGLTAVVLTL